MRVQQCLCPGDGALYVLVIVRPADASSVAAGAPEHVPQVVRPQAAHLCLRHILSLAVNTLMTVLGLSDRVCVWRRQQRGAESLEEEHHNAQEDHREGRSDEPPHHVGEQDSGVRYSSSDEVLHHHRHQLAVCEVVSSRSLECTGWISLNSFLDGRFDKFLQLAQVLYVAIPVQS